MYIVKPGDTLMRIGLETGQSWRDLARWNGLDNPNALEVGQALRVVPPGADPAAVNVKPISTPKFESKPLDARTATPASAPAPSATAPTATAPTVTVPISPTSAPSSPKDSADDLQWAWPASGAVVAGFDDSRTKGLVISGKAGDPVLAAADGFVVYAGSGLRGYGNLIIVKHNATYLSAYAHNQTLLVKEDQAVKRGQKIAEMGASDAERVQLHFEIRRMGKPIDPSRVLPSR
jgi:lipoprotein NlpD